MISATFVTVWEQDLFSISKWGHPSLQYQMKVKILTFNNYIIENSLHGPKTINNLNLHQSISPLTSLVLPKSRCFKRLWGAKYVKCIKSRSTPQKCIKHSLKESFGYSMPKKPYQPSVSQYYGFKLHWMFWLPSCLSFFKWGKFHCKVHSYFAVLLIPPPATTTD